jgi:hypothetical protein
MRSPISATVAGAQRLLKLALEAFHHTIGLGMVCPRQDVLNPQLLAQHSPHCAGELQASVLCDEGGDAEAGDPTSNRRLCRPGLRWRPLEWPQSNWKTCL